MTKEIVKSAVAIVFICLQSLGAVNAGISNETACYVSNDVKPVKFEFHTYYDSSRKWSGGFVRYESAKELIPVVFFSSTTADDLGEGMLEPSSKWLEISREKISGEYILTREGAGTGVSGYVATYRNYAKNKVRNFVLAPAAGFGESGCNWAN
ncbi:hypothetical protein ACSFA7_13635 [Variovorax sp. LT1R20]|uniref:hypothetical protein n=1 Tax=Variovorax sp. LT1R20 TaxID=3443729 RepID=UPI003F4607D6